MGLDRTIRFPSEPPEWGTIRERLIGIGEEPQVRMIDGLPAFPNEIPEPGWKELRVGFSAGMVTIRRAATSFSCVVWGNANAELIAACDRLLWACADAGNGTIETPGGSLSAHEFARVTGLRNE